MDNNLGFVSLAKNIEPALNFQQKHLSLELRSLGQGSIKEIGINKKFSASQSSLEKYDLLNSFF